MIESRAARGCTRDCHGDLHLDHVYVFPDRAPRHDLVIVDCIEFNERYRFIDPIADMAFAAMDFIYHGRRDALCEGLCRIGWEVEKPKGTMFLWAPIPQPYREMGSLEFASFLVREAKVAVSPGEGFGPGGDDYVRFALIENEQRIGQAVRNLRRALSKL